MKLLTTNAKLSKSVKGYLVMGLQLAPHNLSGRNVCPNASEGCKAGCLFTAGMGVYSRIRNARIAKTKLFFASKDTFLANLFAEIEYYERRAKKKGLKLALRLNTISDIPWEKHKYKGETLMAHFPNVQFYDYTKNLARAVTFGSMETAHRWPKNYHLTFSRSESNEKEVKEAMLLGVNIAVVFKGSGGKVTRGGHNKTAKLPLTFMGKKVINGDVNDARWLDPDGVVVGLLAKGKARKDKSGFVV